ncbi:MAG: 5-amino-6-(D-ribitylamino)uracil--L-tyrosine 4-hydroxyphenyl transferase CofH, partial [Legionella sp.]|nr:5-amino-6-(D-ribitylamino)uracil--L-tyrosine 4-hydroxyphenyl transferase CofH [Legionella sp.]
AARVQQDTGLLAHANPGTMTAAELRLLRTASVSQGMMLESVSPHLAAKGGAHYGAPDKAPAARISTLVEAGKLAVPFTTGILIGIGETRLERIQSLLTIKAIHARYGHIQEVIVQNFVAKPGTRMSAADNAAFDDLLWTTAVARLILGPAMHIQVPPNLSFARFPEVLNAGIDDWGGVSPVTPDHVNPEAPWPQIEQLRAATEKFGGRLVARLPIYPDYLKKPKRWLDAKVATVALRASDSEGWARADAWSPGAAAMVIQAPPAVIERARPDFDDVLHAATQGTRLSPAEVGQLFEARGSEINLIAQAANDLRQRVNGDTVTYVVNRNINYTNICGYKCGFCAFSKGKTSDNLRGTPYLLSLDEVARRAVEAWDRGATEVCMQGGSHPTFTGQTYLDIVRTVKNAVPGMHVHAFSPLEVTHGAQTLGIAIPDFLAMLRDEGLGTLPGTAAEILHDDVRRVICPDKLDTQQWLGVIEAAHRVGLRTTATIMFGHVDNAGHWAAHLLHIRDLQERTGGFTEFVPLPFVHMESPLYFKGGARRGPTSRETLLMHAVARLVLHPVIGNIQTSWVKLGEEGVAMMLASGVNDLGGTLMNESISRAAGTEHGQEWPPQTMDRVIAASGRRPKQRTTLYGDVVAEQRQRSFNAAPLAPLVLTAPAMKPARAAATAEG